jgi:hypothetical protein
MGRLPRGVTLITKSDVELEIKNWISNYLDVPSEFYNGLKPCPFAMKALQDRLVDVILMSSFEDIEDLVFRFRQDSKQIYVVAFQPETKGLEEECERLNKGIGKAADIVCIPFMPPTEEDDDEEDGDPELSPEGWGSVVDEAYPMVMIQGWSELNKMSQILESRGYYRNVSESFLKYVLDRRKESPDARQRQEENERQKNGSQEDQRQEDGAEENQRKEDGSKENQWQR